MIETVLLVFFVLTAWRLPFIFDYLILAPFLGTALGMWGWLILGAFGVDIWRLPVVGSCVLGGVFLTSLFIARVTKRG